MESPDSHPESLWTQTIAPKTGLSREARISPIDEGYSTEVYQVDLESGKKVLRLYPLRNRSRINGYLAANRLLTSFDMTVPAIDAWGAEKRIGWVVEERIEGTPLVGLLEDPSAIDKVAETLAELHSHTRGRYGEASGWGGFRLTLRWRQRFPERWRKVTRLFPELSESTERVLGWYRDWADSFSPRTYQLLHNDFHPGNVMLTSDGKIALLDLRSPRYGLGLLELIEAAHSFCGEEPSDWGSFANHYLSHSDPEMTNSFERHGEGCHAVFHLRQADRFADLALGSRGSVIDRRRWERNAFDSWERFCRISGVVGPVSKIPATSAFIRRKSST